MMKSKNMVIGLVAFVFALTSAFVSPKFAPQSIWVKAKLTSSSPLTCQQTVSTCESLGATYNCVVNIETDHLGAFNVLGRSGTACTSVLTSTRQQPIPTTLKAGVFPYYVE